MKRVMNGILAAAVAACFGTGMGWCEELEDGLKPVEQVALQEGSPSDTLSRARPVEKSYLPPQTKADRERQEAASARRAREAASGDPDVLLDVPNLSVESIELDVENLTVHLALDARLANLLSLSAGADASIDKVKLTIHGVRAEALLKVRLDNVAAIIDRTLTTIDRNPEILERLLTSVDKTVNTVGQIGQTALQPGGILTQTINALGQTVTRALEATGNIVERTVDAAGRQLNSRNVGHVRDLPVVNESRNAAGQLVRQVRDSTGAILEFTTDTAGKIVNTRVVKQASTGSGRKEPDYQ